MKNIVGGQLHHKGARFGIALTMVASLILGGIFVFTAPAQAAHTATVDAMPTIVAGGATNTYSFTIANNSGSANSIYLINFTAPTGFTITGNPTCPTDWGTTHATSGATASCTGDPDPSSNLKIQPGTGTTISFPAISSAPGADTLTSWTVATKDDAFITVTNSEFVNIDVTPPTTTDNAPGGWLNTSPATIILSATDTMAEVAATYYTLADLDPTTSSPAYEGPISITSQGTTTLKYFSVDHVGNTEDVRTNTVSIDITAPTISSVTITLPEGQTAVKEGDIIAISADVTDGTSGVASVTVDLSPLDGLSDFALEWDELEGLYIGDFLIPVGSVPNGDKTLAVTATDIAGNAATDDSASVFFDNTAPVINDLSIATSDGVNATRNGNDIIISGTVTEDTLPTLVSATLRQYDASQQEIVGGETPVIITLEGNTFSGTINVGTLDETAEAIAIEIVVTDESQNQTTSFSSILQVDNFVPELVSTTLTPPQTLYPQINVKDTDEVQVLVETDSNTANEVTIDASAFGAENNIPLVPVGGSETQFAGEFIINSNGANAIVTISVSVRRINNGAVTDDTSASLAIDNTLPTFSLIAANPNPATDGTVTITFTASETLLANPTVMVNDALATSSEGSIAPDYTYTYEVADNNEVLLATVTIAGVDEAGNQGTDDSASFTIDTLEPTISTVSSDGARFNAGIKTITTTFSEDIKLTPLPQIAITYSGSTGNCPNVPATDMTRVDPTSYTYNLTVEETCNVETPIVTISAASDLAGNVMIENSAHTFAIDTLAPTITSAITADSNGDGQIDTIVVNFDEDLDGESVTAGDFTVTGYVVTNAVESATGTVTLTITESGTPDTGETPQVDIISSIADLAGNEMTAGNIIPADGAGPAIISAITIDASSIEVTFSENLSDVSVATSDFTVEGSTLTDASELDGVVTLTLGMEIGTGDTPPVTVNANSVEDTNENTNNSSQSVAPKDGIAPVVTSVTLSPTSPVKAEEIIFTITFSEPMDDLVTSTITYDPKGGLDGATPQTITQSSFTGTTWVGTATIPSGDAANYDGTAIISISGAADTSSNVMSEDTSAGFDIDTVAPDAPSVDVIASPQDIDSVQVTGTAEADSFIAITGGLSTATGTADGLGNFSITVDLTQDAINNLSVTATDAAGNVSSATMAEVVEDSTPPEAPNITTTSQITNGNTIAIDGTAEADSTVTITGGTVEATDTATGGNFSIEVTLNQNTLNTLFITATDAAENESVASMVEITHDNILPTALFVTETLPAELTNQTSAAISVSNGDVTAYKYDLDGGGYSVETDVATPISLTNITEGAHTLSVVGRDEAGNWQVVATTYSWVVDITAPVLDFVVIYSDNEWDDQRATVGNIVTLEFASDDDIETPIVTIAGGEATVTGEGMDWTAEYTMTGTEPEGLIAFTIDFTDIAGNDGTTVTTTTDALTSVTFDRTAPLVDVTSPLSGESVNGNATIFFSNNETTNPECSIDGENWTSCASESTTLSGIPGFDTLAEGVFTLYLQDTDLTGNTSNDNETGVIKDTIAPNVLSHTPGTNAVNVEPASAITITFSEAVNVGTEGISFSPWISFTVDGSGTNTITLTPDPEFTNNTVYTITISTNPSDAAGNQLQSEYSWQFTTATQYDIALYMSGGGWNLISLPIIPNDKSISAVLGEAEGSVEAVWTYDPSHPNAVDGWLAYIPGDPEGTNNLDTMTAGYGYWISMSENANLSGAGNLLTAGPNLPPSRDLSAGWNLIGYYQIPGESSSYPTSAFSSLGGTYTGLWGFDNTAGSFKSTIYDIFPGDAFWISLPSAKTYTPSNVNET